MKIIFSGKRKNVENFLQGLKIVSKTGRGNLKQREMHHSLRGMDALCIYNYIRRSTHIHTYPYNTYACTYIGLLISVAHIPTPHLNTHALIDVYMRRHTNACCTTLFVKQRCISGQFGECILSLINNRKGNSTWRRKSVDARYLFIFRSVNYCQRLKIRAHACLYIGLIAYCCLGYASVTFRGLLGYVKDVEIPSRCY